MKLSDGEKIIIAMLADIHKHLGIKDETDVKHVMESIYSGNLWSLKREMPGLLHDHEANPDDVRETADIMDMWWIIELGFEKLGEDEKARVRAETDRKVIGFSGFDANNEPHYGIAQHFVQTLGSFSHFRGRDLNSHMQLLPGYRRMLEIFLPLRSKLGDRDLTADEIIALVSARKHPEAK